MFVRDRVIKALEANAKAFSTYKAVRQSDLDNYQNALLTVASLSRPDLGALLAHEQMPGALPTTEQGNGPIQPFATAWKNHQEARAWAMQILRGQTTFAVDGSQIPPQRTISPPVAMVQIGWFENRHLPGGQYEKDVEIEILPPEVVRNAEGVTLGEAGELAVSLRRYVMETERITRYMREHAGQTPAPVAFFDGSLVASFAGRLPDDIHDQYIDATVRMLVASEQTRIPLIGYVDTSYAHDLVTMVQVAQPDLPAASRLSDAALLDSLTMKWGDRSTAYICARHETGVLDNYQDTGSGLDFSRRVAFTYLKTTQDGPPSRVEFPLWILEDGRLDATLDVVRAEAVVGNGYPYPIETADAVAVLTMEDRERFHHVFQQFAQKHDLPLRHSRKAMSKRQRRV